MDRWEQLKYDVEFERNEASLGKKLAQEYGLVEGIRTHQGMEAAFNKVLKIMELREGK